MMLCRDYRFGARILVLLASFVATTLSEDRENAHRIFPMRTQEEAAVIEWGHSAIISGLDVSVAYFGPQTSDAAVFEVETTPTVASPFNGVMKDDEGTIRIRPLYNADSLTGNVVVMTTAGNELTAVQMAQIAQLSGAAALLVVNVDEEQPDEIYRMQVLTGEEEIAATIDIPVVMMSYNSAAVLTTATVTPETKPEEVVNHGMPERIRLYGGGDRPFFEDAVASSPAVYLIHNLLTESECASLIRQASSKVLPITHNDPLQLLESYESYHNIQRVLLWQGMLKGTERKAIDERIEQATGFPADQMSDFVVERFDKGSRVDGIVDRLEGAPGGRGLPMASFTIFLNAPVDVTGGNIVYPSAKVQVRPQLGLSVIHHNVFEDGAFDANSKHAVFEYNGEEPLYVARKYVFSEPYGNGRRLALPVFAAPFGGRLPLVFSRFYAWMVEQFGVKQGGAYFDKACVFVPVLLVAVCVQYLVEVAQKSWSSSESKPKRNGTVSSVERRGKKKKAS